MELYHVNEAVDIFNSLTRDEKYKFLEVIFRDKHGYMGNMKKFVICNSCESVYILLRTTTCEWYCDYCEEMNDSN